MCSSDLLTRLPNGNTFGEEALIPTRCYVGLIEILLKNEVDVHALLPGTGSGVGKVAFDHRPHTYRIYDWPEVPPIFLFMRELGVSERDCLTTFNWGVGYYVFVPGHEVSRVLTAARIAGYEALEIGRVKDGDRRTVFEPIKGMVLPPPGE